MSTDISNINLKIRKAKIMDIEKIMEIISLCTNHMISNNIFQWDENYPSKQTFIDDINMDYLLVLLLKDSIVGCVSVYNVMDDFYKKIKWKIKSN